MSTEEGNLMPGGWEWLLIVAILLLLFGAKRLPEMARSVGQSARVFKGEMKGMKADDEVRKPDVPGSPSATAPPATVVTPTPPAVTPPAATPPAALPPVQGPPVEPSKASQQGHAGSGH